jgi:6-phosphogluconolactonase
LREVQRIACGGHVPWSFSITPSGKWLIVANEASGSLAAFRVDPASGKLTATDERAAVPKPVSIAVVSQ